MVRNLRGIIQTPTVADDGSGGDSKTWAELQTVFFSVKHLRGRELLLSQQVTGEVTYRVNCEYVAGVTRSHRILLDDGRIFDIHSVNNVDERNRELEMMCSQYG